MAYRELLLLRNAMASNPVIERAQSRNVLLLRQALVAAATAAVAILDIGKVRGQADGGLQVLGECVHVHDRHLLPRQRYGQHVDMQRRNWQAISRRVSNGTIADEARQQGLVVRRRNQLTPHELHDLDQVRIRRRGQGPAMRSLELRDDSVVERSSDNLLSNANPARERVSE